MTITFVTSWFDIYKDYIYDNKTKEWRLEMFKDILSTGINICIYVSPEYKEDIEELSRRFENLKLMRTMKLEETVAYKCCEGIEISLPQNRNEKKDTFEYMVLMNSKIEFTGDVARKNPFNSTHFAWIDFSISYMIRNKDTTLTYLKYLSERDFKERFFYIPGCVSKYDGENVDQFMNNVLWRFCGSFLMLDRETLISLIPVYYTAFREFLMSDKRMIWEVNFWALLEYQGHWSPTWYSADHNDSIIYVPSDSYIKCLDDKLEKTTYPYPEMTDTDLKFRPSSASYIFYKGKHILNTRLVNYSYCGNGNYNIDHPNNTLLSKNIRSYLDPETFLPICYGEMYDTSVALEPKDCYSHGLEDIRLFEHGGKLCFICTNVNYSPCGRNRMIMGEYHPEELCYTNCRILEPPEFTWCEKNWIPLSTSMEGCDDTRADNYFIYSWSPMKIGRITKDSNVLEIVKEYRIIAPNFHKVRGSTIFIEEEGRDTLLGVVHFSEDGMPRNYYHMLVRLEKGTYKPLEYSLPFCFQFFGVEFCIGFTIKGGKYVFWISRRDNNAMMVSIDRGEILVDRVF
jgi:hypothetical protein